VLGGEPAQRGAGLISGCQLWINHQVPSLGKDLKSHVQLFAIDEKNKINLDHISTRCSFLESRDLPCVSFRINKKFDTEFYPDPKF